MNNDPRITFGERLKALRLLAGISQEELSYRAGLSKNYISDVECGRRNISLLAIYQLAHGLKVPVESLFLQ